MESTSVVRFRLLEPLGRTPACQVWRAYDAAAGEDVAVKVLNIRSADDDAHAQRFVREAKKAAALGHPHVVGVLDSGVSDGRPYLTMPLLAGDLRAAVISGPLSVERTLAIVEQVAAALDAARRVGLVHGDLKPSNVLFDAKGAALLSDFGGARGTGRSDDAITSWAYFAPEYLADGRCDERTDVYGLAGLLYFCLAGGDPFTGTVDEQIRAHLGAAPPRPSQLRARLPGVLDAVIATGMAKDPELRYPTAQALARAARAASRRGRPEPGRPEPLRPEPLRPGSSASSVPARLPPMTLAVRTAPTAPIEVRRPRRLVRGGSALVLAVVTAVAGVMAYVGREGASVPAGVDGAYRADFGATLTLDGSGPSDAGPAMPMTTMTVRSTCRGGDCVAVATVEGAAMDDGVEPATATGRFVLDTVDGAWVSVTEGPDGRGGTQWRVLSLRRGDDGGLTGTYSYVGDGRGAQRPVTLLRTGDAPSGGRAEEDPANLPPRTRSPAQNLRGQYQWTRTAVHTTTGIVEHPVEVVKGLQTFTNCLRTGERCFSLLANDDHVGVLMTYATGTWTSRSDRELRCRDHGTTQAVRTFEMPMPSTVPDPVTLLEGRGHLQNTGDCSLSTDIELALQRTGD